MRTYASSRVKRKSFYRKSKLQMFLLISGGHIGAPIWRLRTKLYKGAWNVSPNNSETMGHKDLRLGQIFYILVFYNISFSWLLSLDGFQFKFLLRDSENDLFIWTELKTLQRMNFTRHWARRWPHHVIRSQSNQSKQLSFPPWPDLAVGFPNKRSGWEISGEEFVAKRALQQITALQHSLLCGLKRMTDMLTKCELYCTFEAWTALRK